MKSISIITKSALLAVLVSGVAFAGSSDPQASILKAAQGGESQLKLVISSGIHVDASDDDGETALMEASEKGWVQVVHELLKQGAAVNRVDEDGRTALMYAANKGQTEVVKALIAAGANINARDEDGETALQIAENENHTDTAAVLRAAGSERP